MPLWGQWETAPRRVHNARGLGWGWVEGGGTCAWSLPMLQKVIVSCR